MSDPSTSFRAISLSHVHAPVAIREKMYLNPDNCRHILRKLKEGLGIKEALVFSTCNRTEVYYIASEELDLQIIRLICIEKGFLGADEYIPFFDFIKDSGEAIQYLFEVSMGLQSHVLGDLQIINQIKQAYTLSHEAEMAGAFLHRLLHSIFHTNKRVTLETEFRDGAASVSYAAAEFAKELTQKMDAPKVLVVGLGEMGKDVARSLDKKHFQSITLANRTLDKALSLSDEMGGEVLAFEEISQHLHTFDMFISGVTVEKPIWDLHIFAKSETPPPFILDLGMPRSISLCVNDLPEVQLYNIDDIHARTSKVLALRQAAKASVFAIIIEECKAFGEWRAQLQLSPTIQKIKASLEEIRKEEMARFLKNANKEETQLVDDVTKGIMNKFMKLPVMQLKDACRRGEQENTIDFINELFDLERTRKKKSEIRGQKSDAKGQNPE